MRGHLGVLRRSTVVALVVGVLFLNLAMVSLWAWRTFASSQGFADTTTDMLKEPAVREVLADQIVNSFESTDATSGLTITARPLVEAIVEQIVATPAFRGVLHAGIRELHSGLVEGSRSSLIVDVDDAAVLVRQGVAAASPSIAEALPDPALDVAVGISQSTPVDTAIRVASLAGWLAAPFALAAVACLAWAVQRARDRRRALEIVGLTMVGVGVVHFALLAVGLHLTSDLGDTDRERTALRAVYWSIGHLLNVQAKVLITTGLVIAIAAAHAGTGQIRVRLIALVDRIGAALVRPGWRALACVALIAAGYFAIRWPEASTAIVVRTLAVGAFLAGAVGLLDVIGSVRWTAPAPAPYQRGLRRAVTGVTLGVAACSVTLFFGGLAFVRGLRAPDNDVPSMAETGCNGHLELCDRRLDEVVFAGTHNSMAASRDDFLAARHYGGIGAQLAGDVRAFLIDLHYGSPSEVSTLVRTDLRREGARTLAESELTPEERATALRVIEMAGAGSSSGSDVYLCHALCELGAAPAEPTFREIHDFLRQNPNEVVVLVLQDHVNPEDAMRALDRGGLADRALSWAPGQSLPTLGEMIEEDHNVVVLAENHGGAAPWYMDAFELLQETPYAFAAPEEFSCGPSRGDADNPMLLVNHWVTIDPPTEEIAAEVNDSDVLLGRAERCAAERDRVPNIVAVDFYSAGDLVAVVDELNGVS